MINGPRPVASLGPALLARKGGARPAMRPQLALTPLPMAAPAGEPDDLGWNDMGTGHNGQTEPAPRPVASPTPSPTASEAEQPAERATKAPAQLRAAYPAPGLSQAEQVTRTKKSAFTLRLDADRHLKLRLACTVQNRSAQMLLTDLIDRYLADAPDIEALAAHVKRT